MFNGNILKNAKHIHFIGIGGSGMFPIVQILHKQGYYITGSDNNETDTLATERSMGLEVYLGQSAENIKGADLIVYTAAIMNDNPELCAAKASGVPTIERAEMLGYLTSLYDNCICVSGTHGKTTTTAMLTQILLGAGLDPSAVIGGKLPVIGGSGCVGKSDTMVCEACEFNDHFLQLAPDVSIILNIDADHLDYFGTLENIIRSFHKFAEMTTKTVIVNGDDPNSLKAVEGITGKQILTFGWNEKNDYYPGDIKNTGGAQSSFELWHHGESLGRFTLNIPGRHNVLNATSAIAAALNAGATIEQVREHLAKFHGAGRRFEILGNVRGITIADDYAHHPTELSATLNAAKEMPFKKVWAVFQPFTYSRTQMLMDDFAKALSIADEVVMSEIMGSREKNTYGVYTSQLAEKIPGSVWFPAFEEMADYVMSHAQEGDLVITMGCGDVYKCAKMMLKH
ncbi:UDP-N-acetylmuramate--L-alanine ligase [Oscillospiraceae bacterium PP1C4]